MFKREEKGRTLSFVLLSSDKSFVRQIIYETQESVMSRGLSLRFLLVMQDKARKVAKRALLTCKR